MSRKLVARLMCQGTQSTASCLFSMMRCLRAPRQVFLRRVGLLKSHPFSEPMSCPYRNCVISWISELASELIWLLVFGIVLVFSPLLVSFRGNSIKETSSFFDLELLTKLKQVTSVLFRRITESATIKSCCMAGNLKTSQGLS